MSAPGLVTSPAIDALLHAMRERQRAGDLEGALEVYAHADPQLRSAALPRYAHATVLHALGRLSEAEADLRAALALAPGTADIIVNLAVVLLESGRTQRGAEVLALLQQISPSDPHIQSLRATVNHLQTVARRP